MIRLCVLIFFIASFYQVCSQPSIVWTFKTGGKVYSSPTLDGESLYIGSEDGNLYAINLSDGKERWRFRTGGMVHSSPLVAENSVIVNSHDGNLYCLDGRSGKLIWKFQTDGERIYDMWDYYLSSPVDYHGTIFFGSGDSHIYALNRTDGRLKWKYKTEDIVHATPAVADGFVYVGSFDGNLYALNAATGALKWKFKTIGDKYFPKGEIQRGANSQDSVIYFGSRDYNLYAVNVRSGRGEWNMKEYGSWVIATPAVIGDILYVGTSDSHKFYALKKGYGEIVWTLSLTMRVYGSAVAHQDRIYFGCFNGILYGVNLESGTIEWSFQTDGYIKNHASVFTDDGHFKEGFELYGSDMIQSENTILSLGSILSTPVISNGVIYFGSADGNIYAVRL